MNAQLLTLPTALNIGEEGKPETWEPTEYPIPTEVPAESPSPVESPAKVGRAA